MSVGIPTISILIPNYNKAAFLSETLDSIQHQSFKDWECIIVDDHSTDESVSIINQYTSKDHRFQLHTRPSSMMKGGNVCRNYALTKARGEFVVFFDSDDWLLSDALEKRRTLITQGNYDFVACQGLFWNGKSAEGLLISELSDKSDTDCFFDFQPLWLTQGVIIKKKFLEETKLVWNESIPFLQDVFYNIGLLLHTKAYFFSQEIDWVWRKSNNLSLGNRASEVNSYEDNRTIAQEMLLLYNKYHSTENNWFKQFCLKRFYDLLTTNPSKLINSALMAYPDVLSIKLKSGFLKAMLIKVVARIGIVSYRYQWSMGKSLFFRIWKKKWMNSINNKESKHFLTKPFLITQSFLNRGFEALPSTTK